MNRIIESKLRRFARKISKYTLLTPEEVFDKLIELINGYQVLKENNLAHVVVKSDINGYTITYHCGYFVFKKDGEDIVADLHINILC